MAALGRHAVLGILIARPAHGYAIGQRLQRMTGADRTTVYPILNRLEADGEIKPIDPRAIGATERGAPRVRYAPTDAGVAAFSAWMRAPIARQRLHDDLEVKLEVARPEDLPQLLAMAQAQRVECLEEVLAHSRAPLADPTDTTMPWARVAMLLAERRGALQVQADADWLDEVCASLELRVRPSGR